MGGPARGRRTCEREAGFQGDLPGDSLPRQRLPIPAPPLQGEDMPSGGGPVKLVLPFVEALQRLIGPHELRGLKKRDGPAVVVGLGHTCITITRDATPAV